MKNIFYTTSLVLLAALFHPAVAFSQNEYTTFNLVDGVGYNEASDVMYNVINYTRTFVDNDWNCLYIPLSVPVSAFKANGCQIYLINMFHQTDSDNDGVFDAMTMEVLKMTPNLVLLPNHPYLIKDTVAFAENEKSRERKFVFTNTTLYAAATKAVTCSSMTLDYTFQGTYSPVAAEQAYTLIWNSAISSVTLGHPTDNIKPQRWYMTMNSRTPQYVTEPIAQVKEINIVVGGETTGINEVEGFKSQVSGGSEVLSGKFLENGRVVILKNGIKYNLAGQKISSNH